MMPSLRSPERQATTRGSGIIAAPSRRAVLAAALAAAAGHASRGEPGAGGFAPSFTAGATDPAGRFMGGTELRCLAAHGGRLFAGNSYWEDSPGSEGRQGAQILRLDSSGGHWQVDHAFDALLRPGRPRHLAVCALADIVLRTDQHGAALPEPRSLLLASTWDLTGTRSVFARDDATGGWSATALAQDRPRPGFLPQIRAIASHRDRRTVADMVFAGDSAGVFAAGYDSGAGGLRWGSAPELPLPGLASDQFPGLAGRLRISSFAEAEGRLFAAIGQQVWVREDGAAPQWHLVATNPMPFYSQTGLRGLTTIADPGRAPALLAAVEGQRSRIVRIDPRTGEMVTELALDGLLDRAWGTRVSYVIAAYNDMTRLARADGDHWLLGLEAFIPARVPRPPGHRVLDVIHGLEGGGWFLVRGPGGAYRLHQVTTPSTTQADLVAVRAACVPPFADEPGTVYLGGYDANGTPTHDTAWVMHGRLDADL